MGFSLSFAPRISRRYSHMSGCFRVLFKSDQAVAVIRQKPENVQSGSVQVDRDLCFYKGPESLHHPHYAAAGLVEESQDERHAG